MSGSHVPCFHHDLRRKERIMLPPVPAISNVNAVSQKQAAAVSSAITGLSTPSAATVALSNAASASAEGKLAMLMMALRARMVQSLLDIMSTVSEALDTPQEQNEDNVSHALRLADIIQDLSPKQLASVQQQLQAQGQTLPLQLIAQALKNPAGPQAAQITALLEKARYSDRDLVAEAVIESYSENEGAEAEAPHVQPQAQPQAQTAASTAVPVAARASQPGAPAQASPPHGAATAGTSDQPEPIATVPQTSAKEFVTTADKPAVQIPADAAEASPTSADAIVAEALETIADGQQQEPAPLAPQLTKDILPVALKQIAADVEEGLKLAVQSAIEVAGPEIAGILAEGEPLANAVIADALVADVLDAAELQQQDAAQVGDDLPAPVALNLAAGMAGQAADDDGSPAALDRLPNDVAPQPAVATPAAVAAQQPVPMPLGIPYAVPQYPLADDPIVSKDDSKIDRVEAVGDEPEGNGGQQERPDEDDGEQAEARRTMEEGGDQPAVGGEETLSERDETARDAAPVPLSLPAPSPSMGLQLEAYGFYQRMAAE
jgi:hypothetical protein